MSLWTSLTKVFRKALPAVASVALPGAGGALVGGLSALASSGGGSSPARLPATTTAPAQRTMPNIPAPGINAAISRVLPGGQTGYLSRGKFHTGKLSGQPVRNGFREKMSPHGVIYLVKNRRRRGITAKDLATFRRVHKTLKTYSKKCK